MAQSVYDQGDLLETEEAITSQNVLFYSQGGYGTGYLNGTGAFAQAISKTCLYRLEATGESVDGHNIYLIKQVSTGLYVKDHEVAFSDNIGDSSDEGGFASGDFIDMTSSAAEAMKVTVVIAEKGSDDPYAGATEGKGGEQDLSYTAFVIRRAELVNSNGKDYIQYFGHLGKPFFSNYPDTNAWHIYSVTEPTGRDKVLAYTAAYFGTSNADPATTYTIGTTPGTYKAELVNPAHQAWQEAFDALQVEGQFPLTDEQVDELCVRIESTMEALQSKNAYNDIVPGYYFIKSSAGRYLYGASQSTNDFVYAGKAGEDINPSTLTASNLKYLWKVIDTPSDSLYTIQNVVYGKNLGGASAKANPGGDNGYGFTIAADAKVVVMKGVCKNDDGTTVDNAVFNIINPTKEPANSKFGYHSKFDNRPVMGWDAVNSINNCYTFTPVEADEATIAALLAQEKQDKLNATLAELVTTADGLYKEGTGYKAAEGFTYTNDFSEEGKLVSPAEGENDDEKETNSHWYSNKKQGNEGTYEALVDNNPDTYFHSNWADGAFTPSITKNHYLVATLDAPVSGDIMVKMAKRMTGNDFPIQVAIYGTNEFDKANANAAKWTFQGFSNISWTDSVEISGTGKTIPDGVGAAYMHLDGSYKYIKIAATKTVYNFDPNDQNNTNGFLYNRGYFCLSEMNIWPTSGLVTTLSPEYQEAMTAAPEVYAALGEEINKAAAELAANKATQAQIDALNAAIEAFKNNIPVPSRVTDAYNAAKAFLDAANTNNLIGTELAQYSQETADALQTTLAKYETFDKIDLVSINAAVNEINAAFSAFKGSVRLPEAGKFYTIKSASTKVVAEADKDEGYQGAIYNAIVYSTGNNKSNSLSDANSAVRFTFANHSSEVTADGETSLDAMMSSLSDSISLKDDASYVWKAETAQDGKMVLRNLATGMYLTGANGKLYQSTEPTPILGEGVKPNVFRFNLGEDANGVTQYMNTKGATGTVVPWRNPADENSYWQFNELADDDYTTESFAVKGVKEGQFYACTFPVAVTPDGNAVLYTVLGVNEAKDKLILAEVEDEVPAGTPVILLADVLTNNGEGTVGNLTVGCEDLASATFVFEPKVGDGLCGVLCEPVEIAETCGHLANGKIVTGAYTVPCNGAYLANAAITAEKGKASIDLAKGVGDTLTGIDDAKVVVLPSVVNVYGINGQLIKKSVKAANATKNLPAGVYVIGGQKVLVK